jgi:hypothetical protein
MEQKKVIFLAFNKSIADELQVRLDNLNDVPFLNLSDYQTAVKDFVLYQSGNAVVQAVAGSGKTTTLMQTMKHLKEHGEQNGIDYQLTAQTTNSLAWNAALKYFGKKKPISLNQNKIGDIIKEHFPYSAFIKDISQLGQFGEMTEEIEQFLFDGGIHTIDYAGYTIKGLTYFDFSGQQADLAKIQKTKNGIEITYLIGALKGTKELFPFVKTAINKQGKKYNVTSAKDKWFKTKNAVLEHVKEKTEPLAASYASILVDKPIEIDNADSLYFKMVKLIKAMVGFAKNSGVGLLPDLPVTLKTFENIYLEKTPLIGSDPLKNVIPVRLLSAVAKYVFTMSMTDTKNWDFNDQFYLTLKLNVPIPYYDLAFLDECQDTNIVTQLILERMIKGRGRCVAVGDVSQAIYGFRGADSSAMQKFEKNFNATLLPLSICYRCATSIVRAAKYYTPQIEAASNAPLGMIQEIDDFVTLSKKMTKAELKTFFSPETAIICRTNAPLIKMLSALFSKGIKATMMGKSDEGKQVKGVVDKYALKAAKKKKKVVDELSVKEMLDHALFVLQYRRELAKEEKDEDLLDDIQQEEDTVTGLAELAIYKYGQTVKIPMLFELIDAFFSDKVEKTLTLTTIHKSKGLEFSRVILLDFEKRFEFKPVFEDQIQWMMTQEYNMSYVAITRAENELYFMKGAKADDQKQGKYDDVF